MLIVLPKVPTWASLLCKGLFLDIVSPHPPPFSTSLLPLTLIPLSYISILDYRLFPSPCTSGYLFGNKHKRTKTQPNITNLSHLDNSTSPNNLKKIISSSCLLASLHPP